MDEGEYYLIKREYITEILSELENYYLVEYEEHPPGTLSMPVKVQLQVTRKCNLRCLTCAVADPNKNNKAQMSSSQAECILEELYRYAIFHIEWSGGEPLTHPNFIDLSEYAYRCGFHQDLLTNGLLISEKNVEAIKKYCFRTQVSLDDVGTAYEDIVGRRVWSQINRVFNLIKEADIANLIVATVLQKSNAERMHDILKYLSSVGIKHWRISPLVPIGRSKKITWKEYSETIDTLRQTWPELKDRANDLGVKINCFLEKSECEDLTIDDVGKIVSPGGYSYLYITSESSIYPFPFLTNPILYIGNFSKENLRNMWLYSSVLNFLREQTYKNTGCGNCRFECSFHKRALVYGFTGLLDGPALPHPECNFSIQKNKEVYYGKD